MLQARERSAAFWMTMILALGAGAGRAAVIAVDGTTCSLENAILSANSDNAVGGCSAGAGPDTLLLGADVVLTAPATPDIEGGPSGLPPVTTTMTIAADAGSTIERSSALECSPGDPTAFRLFTVAAGGDLSLTGVALRNGCIASDSFQQTASAGAVLVLAGGRLHISGGTLEGNRAIGGEGSLGPDGAARGGAVAVLGGTLEISGSTFTGNQALGSDAHGGAVAVEAGTVTAVATTRFESNLASMIETSNLGSEASSGGALSLRDTFTALLAHLEFVGNVAGGGLNSGSASGGGVEITGGRLQALHDVFFTANVAQAGSSGIGFWPESGRGGGLANFGTIESILRTTFADNQALGHTTGEGRGGGLDNRGRIGAIVSSTFAGNMAEGGFDVLSGAGNSFGGGLANVGEIGRIVASTFVGNRCPQSEISTLFQGGGIYTSLDFEAGSVPHPGVTVTSSLLAGNEANGAPDCYSTAPFSSGGFNLALFPDASCHFSATSDIVGVDPQVEPLADNGCTIALPGGSCLPTVALAPTSPALDAGLCSATGSEIDARGAVRPLDLPGVPNAAGSDACDSGAYERDAQLAAVHLGLAIAESGDPVYGGLGDGNLTYTVALSSVGMQAAADVVVTPALLLPAGVTLDQVTASSGTWDGSTWTHAALASGNDATLAFTLTVGLATSGGTDAVGLSAAVTAATGHSGELAADAEATTVVEGIFIDGFQSGDASAWSLTVGGF